MAILINFLLVLIILHEVDSINFNYSNISPQNQNTDILIMGDTFISTSGMQLRLDTKTKTAGRGIYNRLLHIWDKTSGEQASFSSKFSFLIDIDGYADGFIFFLAENNSVATIGSALGLPVDYSTYKMLNSFVAVEFDAHTDTVIWDQTPEDYHVGINVNSISSSVFKNWSFNFSEGAHCQASITYDSVTKNLSVSVTDHIMGVIDLNYIIDLRHVLPERVIFGFAAGFDKVTLISWSFSSSNLQVDEEKAQPLQSTNQDPVKDNKRTCHKVGLIAGLVVAVLSFLVIVAFYYLWRRNTHRIDKVEYDTEMNKDFEKGAGRPKRFSYNEILQAITSFAEKNKIGEGGFGGVYKGFLKDLEMYVTVKRLSKTSKRTSSATSTPSTLLFS